MIAESYKHLLGEERSSRACDIANADHTRQAACSVVAICRGYQLKRLPDGSISLTAVDNVWTSRSQPCGVSGCVCSRTIQDGIDDDEESDSEQREANQRSDEHDVAVAGPRSDHQTERHEPDTNKGGCPAPFWPFASFGDAFSVYAFLYRLSRKTDETSDNVG